MAAPPKIEYKETDGFQKDLKILLKRYRTLKEDIETAKSNAIELFHLKNTDNHSIFSIPDYCTDEVKVYKLKKFACKSLKGRGVKSGIRIIYALHTSPVPVVELIEIYFKADKENEDRDRIKAFLKKMEKKG